MPKQPQRKDFFEILNKAAQTVFRKADKKGSPTSDSNTSKKTRLGKIVNAFRKQSDKSRGGNA